MPNGLMEWRPLEDHEITLGRVWGVLGLLMERTKVLPGLVTRDQCDLSMAQCKAREADDLGARQGRAGARRFSAVLVIVSCVVSALLAVGGGVLLLKIGG